MGGCASSKYAVDEDRAKTITDQNGNAKPESKNIGTILKKLKPSKKQSAANGKAPTEAEGAEQNQKSAEENNQPNGVAPAAAAESIEFIDKDNANNREDEAKKESTTYQTTVVKHTQKEGDELLAHLKEEAFKTLQSSLKQLSQQNAPQVTKTTSASVETSDSTTQSSSTSSNGDDLVKQIKEQVVNAVGKQKQDLINQIIDSGASLITDNKVNSMNELQAELEKLYSNQDDSSNSDLIKKVINATTGFLTAKGTEAGTILSNILANANAGIQGIMSETEKTTVKVTRTVTEQVLTGGQLKEITKLITTNETVPPGVDIQDFINNLKAGNNLKSGHSNTTTNTQVSEKHETTVVENPDADLQEKAGKVVSEVVSSAVERVNGENAKQLDESTTTENVKVEEQNTFTLSTTKILLNNSAPQSENQEEGEQVAPVEEQSQLDKVQSEFYKHGKGEAEELIKKLETKTTEEPSGQEGAVQPAEN
jgi:hypothetical protein